jgi:uncharacterized membrane protein YagU involved in acid resistance
MEWLKIGTVVGLLTSLVAWGMMAALPAFAPEGARHQVRPALSAPAP